MTVMLPLCMSIVVLYLAYLVTLGFSGAYGSLIEDREADGDRIYLLDRLVMAGAALWIAMMLVPDYLGSHMRFAGTMIGVGIDAKRP